MENTTLDLPQNFVSYLKRELLERNKKNPQYSLRSFSKNMDLSSSFVSKLFNGRRPLTEGTYNKIVSQLSLNPDVADHYRQIEFINGSIKTAKAMSCFIQSDLDQDGSDEFENSITDKKKYKALNLDQFSFIADWYHFAILELLTTENFIFNPNCIASRLGISPLEAKLAIERLFRLGLVKSRKTTKGEKMFGVDNNSTIGRDIATAATLKQQQAFLQMASNALVEVPIEQRSQTSMTMAIPKSRLKEAQRMIHDFRRNMTSLMQRKGKRDSVYQLTISFYPLTKTKSR
jgi:uncharacterized protein (TIGR02147 family)